MKHSLSVTIGIPVYNEGKNIGNLLSTLLKQRELGFRIEQIIVVSDGSTDDTADIVRSWAKKDGRIRLIYDAHRQGKPTRLNYLFQHTKSDILVCVDGDCVFYGRLALTRLLEPFRNPDIHFVSGNNQPVAPSSFFNHVMNGMYLLWYEIRKRYRQGNNIHNHQGTFFALRREAAYHVLFPKKVIAEQQYLFYRVHLLKKKSVFVPGAIVIISLPTNFSDFHMQASRSLTEKYRLATYIHQNDILELYKIPVKFKIKGLLQALAKDPIFTVLGITMAIFLRVVPPKEDPLHRKGMWQSITSTKALPETKKLAYRV